MKRSVKLLVKGTVQGIFFRKFVKENADSLGLKGFVRNLETGNVEIFAEGEKDKIDEFLGKTKQGPAHSQIKEVLVEDKKFSGEYPDFKILRF